MKWCCISIKPDYRGVEQLAARRAHNPKVTGSNPVPATKAKKAFIEGFFYWC
jgi:hypothetical protein